MPIRLLAGVLALVLTGLYVVWLDRAQPAEARAAARLAGERWYRLLMEGEHIGYVHTRSWRDAEGSWRFATLTHFSLNHEAPVSITDRLDFHHSPPYPLMAAVHWNRRGGAAPEGVVMEADGATVQASFVRGTEIDTRPTNWTYRLRDHLGLEVWLAEQRPSAGTRFTARMLDFDRGEPVNRTFRVIEENAAGYLVASPALLRATTIQLDHRLAPTELSMAGMFVVRRAARHKALEVRTPLHLTTYRVPLNRPLDEPGAIERLRLSSSGGRDLSRIWPQARRRGDEWLLELSANSISRRDDPSGALAETLRYPIFHPQVERLAQQAVGDVGDTEERLARLVAFVHEYIAYRPQGPHRTVLETIAERNGDCTEYADLFTTLARSVGLPARTVMGLAYSERPWPGSARGYPVRGRSLRPGSAKQYRNPAYDPQPGLAFHAWNEVAIDGIWRAVDPTWNQVRVDATHIPMPDSQAALLHSMQGQNPLAFEIDDVRYAEDS